MSEPENPPRAYLLGRLSGDARDRFEERMFADDELFFETLTAELDLGDQASRGELSSLDREAYRQRLLRGGAQRVSAEIGRCCAEELGPPRRRIQWRESLTMAARPAAAAVVLLAVIVGGYVMRRTTARAAHESSSSQQTAAARVSEPPAAPSSSTPMARRQEILKAAESALSAGRCEPASQLLQPLLMSDVPDPQAKMLAARADSCGQIRAIPSHSADHATATKGIAAARTLPNKIAPAESAVMSRPNETAVPSSTRTPTSLRFLTSGRVGMDPRSDEAIARVRDQKQVDALMEFEGRAHRYVRALEELEAMEGLLPDNRDVAQQLAATNAVIAYAEGQRFELIHDWELARNRYKRVHDFDPSYDFSADISRINAEMKYQFGLELCAGADRAARDLQISHARQLYAAAIALLPSTDACTERALSRFPDLRR